VKTSNRVQATGGGNKGDNKNAGKGKKRP